MGEKSGTLTNVILTLVALVAIYVVVDTLFPNFTSQIYEAMGDIISGATDSLGTVLVGMKLL